MWSYQEDQYNNAEVYGRYYVDFNIIDLVVPAHFALLTSYPTIVHNPITGVKRGTEEELKFVLYMTLAHEMLHAFQRQTGLHRDGDEPHKQLVRWALNLAESKYGLLLRKRPFIIRPV